MTVEWYDLGQRLAAREAGQAMPRLIHSPVPPVTHPVGVRATHRRGSTTVTAVVPGAPPITAADRDALDLLGDLGVRMPAAPTAPPGDDGDPADLTWRTLVTDDPTTPATLLHLASTAHRSGAEADVAAHLAWWADRTDFPGTGAVVSLLDAARTRWITGTPPTAERAAATWHTWLGINGENGTGMLALLDQITDAPSLPLLDAIHRDDAWAWHRARTQHAEGWDWRRPDSVSRAALGLRSRCDSADLYAGALLEDPLYRRRALHTGHVVCGTADLPAHGRNRITVTCDRLDARLRGDTQVTGWVGPADLHHRTRFSGAITDSAVEHGRLVLTLSGVTANKPSPGDPVSLAPAPPNPHMLASGHRRYRRLYGTRTSWLTTGRTPTPHRRDVPLDVMVAAADD